ncbi:hypothetical protein [Parasedimentitalea denitrificans]|nr:hypothetical protein [Sedimentitalea sp. CY04]
MSRPLVVVYICIGGGSKRGKSLPSLKDIRLSLLAKVSQKCL